MKVSQKRKIQGCFMIKGDSRAFQGSFMKTFKVFQKSFMYMALIAASRAEEGLVCCLEYKNMACIVDFNWWVIYLPKTIGQTLPRPPFFIFEVSDLDKEGLFLKQVSFWYPPFQKVSFLRYKMPLLNLFSLFVEEDL